MSLRPTFEIWLLVPRSSRPTDTGPSLVPRAGKWESSGTGSLLVTVCALVLIESPFVSFLPGLRSAASNRRVSRDRASGVQGIRLRRLAVLRSSEQCEAGRTLPACAKKLHPEHRREAI